MSYCKKTTIFGLIITAAVICVTIFIFFPKKSKEDSSILSLLQMSRGIRFLFQLPL